MLLAALFSFPGFFQNLRCVLFAPLVNGTDSFSFLVFCSGGILVWDLLALVFVAYWLTVIIYSSSGASKPFSSNSLSRCVTICSDVPF